MEQRCFHGNGRKRKNKALYLILQEQGGHGAESGCHYAVHRVNLARSRPGKKNSAEIRRFSAEFRFTGGGRYLILPAGFDRFRTEGLDEPPVTRFKAAPGLAFLKLGSSKIVGVTDKDARVVEPESVVIDAGTWEVSPCLPPASTTCGLVGVSGKIYAVDMFTEDPRCEVLRSTRTTSNASAAGWSPLPRPPFSDGVVSLAAYPPRRGILVSTEKHGAYLLDGAAWVALPAGSAAGRLPLGDRAVYAKDHDLWFEVSPRDGRLRAHDLDVVIRGEGAEAELMHEALRVSDPIPVVVAPGAAVSGGARLVYLGSCKFCVVQVTGGAVTVTVFKVVDSEMPVALAERRRRRRERAINAEWVTDELERACADKASQLCPRRRKLCRVNLWSRTYVVPSGDHGSSVAGVLWM
ncbi:hypothetical protein EJB05_45972, partial [Eragrostis curvula]